MLFFAMVIGVCLASYELLFSKQQIKPPPTTDRDKDG